ncbi:MAG: M12 family metallo-peptidase [Saprospiraceae bacterium]|nr:M12 family metallo-peptidase [Saprospiraceae bacterium]
MIKHISYLFTLIFCLTFTSIEAQSEWKKSDVSNFSDARSEEKIILPEEFLAYTLSYDNFKEKLINTPTEEDRSNGIKGRVIQLPLPDGSFEPFEVYDSPLFMSKLAAKYPSIKSYKGKSLKTPGMTVRFDTGPYGFHAAIHGLSKIYYIDPFAKSTTSEYITYDVKDQQELIDIPGPFCGVDHEKHDHVAELTSKPRSSGPVALSVYRMAIACTGEWGAIRGTPEKALADMNTTLNRINQIFENELAMRLILIDDNDKLLNFDAGTDPYTITLTDPDTDPNATNDEGASLDVNTNIVDLRVGNDSYDIGHLYHTRCNVGGIASLRSMCNNGFKANGLTCHSSQNLNYIASRITAHEIGHQMSAQHTFNNCNGNESSGNAYEPGSGSTIMSYGGLCGSLNVVNDGDDYYHVASLRQIYEHTRGDGIAGDACAEFIETSNVEPTATILHDNNYYIPEDTYFFLEGIGEDDNEEDVLTYTWEQMNIGPTSQLGDPIGDSPHFRSIYPSTSPVRYFPSSDNILGTFLDPTEVNFKGNKTVNFMFTVRDNNSEAGTAVWQPLQFNVVETPEKFAVTSQADFENYEVGDEVDITWNVADTRFAPVNAKTVDILLFTGNAATFSLENTTVLAKNVNNIGQRKVIIPNVVTTKARIIIRASEGNFFAINDRNFRIDEAESTKLFVNSEPLELAQCVTTNEDFTYTISSEKLGDIEGNITYTILDGLPEGATATFSPQTIEVGAESILEISTQYNPLGQEYPIRVGAITESMDTFSRVIYLTLNSFDHTEISAISPTFNESGLNIFTETFTWEPSTNADFYYFELSEDPNFGDSNIEESSRLVENTYDISSTLSKNTVYYWRVTAENDCGKDQFSKTFAFSTESKFCTQFQPATDVLPINISGSGKPTIQAPIEVGATGQIADVNVIQFIGEHSNNKDMRVSLISPEGKQVVLVSNKCEQQDFNCGFDDDSNVGVKCPLNNGSVYAPQGNLSDFNGDELQGTWLFQIEDTKSGNGGKLTGVIVELCSNQVLDNPYIVRNEKIFMPWNGTRTIGPDLLKAEDDNNTSEELLYTIVELPSKGMLTFEGADVNIGDMFSQQDIDADRLVYNANGENYETYFSFTLIDGEGGFIGITNFEIDVNETTSISDQQLRNEVSIYPNPAREMVTIDLSKSETEYISFDILNLHGQLMKTQRINSNSEIAVDISMLTSGMYIVNLKSENNSVAKRIIKN